MPRLPRMTDAKLLTAIPRMRPWVQDFGARIWVLREPGEQMLVYIGDDTELDLSDETGKFRLNLVDTETGMVTQGEVVNTAQAISARSGSVVWMTKDR